MLKGLDKVLAVVSWIVAGLLVLMLFIGPSVVANDSSLGTIAPVYGKPAGGTGKPAGGNAKPAGVDGAQVFQGNCGRCHTLTAAGTNGQVGPNLDNVSLSAADIESIVRSGRGGMPSFNGQLSDAEISAVAAFVAASH